MTQKLPFKVSTLIFVKNTDERFLMLKRNKAPNKGCWTPIGGKVHTAEGESPFECAIRETHEEAALSLTPKDLHLFAMLSEKSYEGNTHWLLFLFSCLKPIDYQPKDISEGKFGFFSRNEIDTLTLPQTDKECLWKLYDTYRNTFVALRVDCDPAQELKLFIEQVH